MRNTKHTLQEIAEAHIIPAKLSAKQKQEADNAFSDFVKQRREAMTDEERCLSRLLQLKYQIEDYLKEPIDSKQKYTFGYFLGKYINSLEIQKSEFSKALDLHVTKLSRLLNNYDEPNIKLFYRLEEHSNNLIPAIDWYRLLAREREITFLGDKKLKTAEKRRVKQKVKLHFTS